MTRVRIALGLLFAAGGVVLFFFGSDSDWLRWTGAGIALFGLALAFWIGAEALPLALVALAAAPASVGLASFAESSPAKKTSPGQGSTSRSTGASTRVTTTRQTTARTTSSTSTRTRTGTTATTGTTAGTTSQAPQKPPQKPKPAHPAELPRTL